MITGLFFQVDFSKFAASVETFLTIPNVSQNLMFIIMLLLLSIKRPHIIKQIRSCSCEPRAVALISKKEVRRFIVDCMVSVGTSTQNACMLASTLLAADEKGYKSHGVNRLRTFLHK